MAEVVQKFFADEDSDEGDVDVEEYYEEEEFFLTKMRNLQLWSV